MPSALDRLIRRLDTPAKIQACVAGLGYNVTDRTDTPLLALRSGRADCFEGALLAAACLRGLGMPPLLMDLRAVNDDDHTIAPFRVRGLWGAISKSNFTILMFREPVYRSLRELAMSYFDMYFNVDGEKSLREYSAPMDLSRFDGSGWETTDADLNFIGEALDRARHYRLIPEGAQAGLSRADPRLLKAGLVGSCKEGLYKPRRRR